MGMSLVSRVGNKLKSFFVKKKVVVKSLYTKDNLVSDCLQVGDFTYGVPSIREWGEGKKVYIGKFCSIAENVEIFLGGNHRVDWISTYPFSIFNTEFPKAIGIKGHPLSKGDVLIGNDVWIGWGVKIMSGVKIGDGAVLGAYTVVTKNVDPYEIVVGNPMRKIKKRFDDETISQLLELSWWNWDIEKINENVDLISSANVKELLKRK